MQKSHQEHNAQSEMPVKIQAAIAGFAWAVGIAALAIVLFSA